MKKNKRKMVTSVISAFIALPVILTLFTMWYINRISPHGRNFEVIDGESFVQMDNGSIRYHSYSQTGSCTSSNQTVLFLHGFNGEIGMWNDTWANLNICANLIRMDIPGFGESKWATENFTLSKQAERIIKFMDINKIETTFIVGTSMGGSLSALLAATYPDRINGLVLLAPSGYTDALSYSGAFGKLISPGWFNLIGKKLTSNIIYKTLFPESKALHAISVVSSYGNTWVGKVKDCITPTTLVWSVGDTVVPFKFAEETTSLFQNSSLLTLDEKVGHNIPRNYGAFVAKVVQLTLNGFSPKEIKNQLKDHLALSTPLTS